MSLSHEIEQFALEELKTLAKIPSISFPNFDHAPLKTSAEATADLFRRSGFQNVEITQIDNCFPYVLAEKIVDPKAPTALLYAHHDVQPPGREELWKTSPFEPTIKEGRLYGRGTADDKAGILVHAAALKALGGKSPMNLKVIIEGEEEVGSDHLLPFLQKNSERLKADVIVVTDTGNIDSGVPTLTRSLRGLVVCEIEVKSLKAPLHSGMWGGGVVDPVQVLIKMIAGLTDSKGKILLKSLGKVKKKNVKGVPITRGVFAEQAGVLKSSSVPSDFLHKIFYEPSFSVNAIQASSEKLANNIICDRAYGRIGIRVTANESAAKVEKELLAKLKSLAPKTVEVSFKFQEPADAWDTDPHSKQNRWAFASAERALERAYGRKAVYIGCGATIPFIKPFEKALKAPVLTLGVEDPYTLAHSENESLLLSDFYKTIEAETFLFHELAKNFRA